ncbi:Na(+)-translocating NADH-quinone reductase subunit A [Vannielia litorea]|uniref:Na+-transporting NADH:ubiquinone oxidoreductase subunit A n=1 Tax=Vannielia litorea TaxID=1217970 RepID=A0A1N6E1V6_9RHOB|nr:Na(+)-translocating NADH-quinone reductase subunit A [Vannielia litorea]SIN76996.1 Na+-transporting NADH:ubiquinone oxidoreductase subunit A [Vannielia litorea]
MPNLASSAGLMPRFSSPPRSGSEVPEEITEEAGVTGPEGPALRIVPLVEEGAVVAQGAPLAHLRDQEGLCLVAPMAGRVARLRLLPGRRLSEIVLFREPGGDRHRHEAKGAEADPRGLMQHAGLWPLLRRRPFGGMPPPGERPAAIVVMAADSRPLAPDPRSALEGREEAFGRGLAALAGLTDGPVHVVAGAGPALLEPGLAGGRVQAARCGTRHPQGLAGWQVHGLAPARIEAPVWDIHAEDVATLGALLETGLVPETRLVHVAGPELRESRLLYTQPGADLRGLTHRIALPGGHALLSGSPLCGRPAHWLGARDRQVSVMPREAGPAPVHWLRAALTRSATPPPVIPTAALDQAFAGALPAAALIRALTAGDEDTAIGLGLLSLLEEDLALADYILGGTARLRALLRAMLDRIETERAA